MNMQNSSTRALPFDQYSRQEIVRRIVETAIRPYVEKQESKKTLKIIDLGGHKGHTKDFFVGDDVTILDVFDENYPGYVRGDATKTKFKDASFDLVVSFDTFEHIPKEKRDEFVREANRIAKYAFIIAAPFDNAKKEISFSEKEANKLYKKIKDTDHPWLAEHISYGIPTITDTEQAIRKTGSEFVRIPTNNLHLWLLTQGIMFNAAVLPADVKEVVDVSRFYNLHLNELEGDIHESYRQVYIGSAYQPILRAAHEDYVLDTDKTFKTTLEYISLINEAYGVLLKRLALDKDYLQAREKHLQQKHDEVARERDALIAENNKLRGVHRGGKHPHTVKLPDSFKRFGRK